MTLGLREILITRAARLAVPELLVFYLGGGQFGNAFEANGDVAQIGNGGVAVLEIEALQKFRGIVRADPLDRIANRIGRPAVASQRVGDLFRRHRRHGQNTLDGARSTLVQGQQT